jgi:hypothetical protein
VTARSGREDIAADPGVGDLLVQLADPLVQLVSVEVLSGQGIPVGLCLSPVGDAGLLLVVGRVWFDDRFVVQVPAFAALRGAEQPGSFGAWRADRGEGVPAGDEDLLDVAGVDVGAAQLDRPQAGAVLGGYLFDHVPGQRRCQPFCPGLAVSRRPGHQAPSQEPSAMSKGPA